MVGGGGVGGGPPELRHRATHRRGRRGRRGMEIDGEQWVDKMGVGVGVGGAGRGAGGCPQVRATP